MRRVCDVVVRICECSIEKFDRRAFLEARDHDGSFPVMTQQAARRPDLT